MRWRFYSPQAVAAVLVLASPVAGQDATPRFEVATLKLSPPPSGASISINLGGFQNGRFTFRNVTLNDALIFAYDLPSKDQLVGLDWTDSVRFDVEALAPPETPRPQLSLMVRQLLAERLHVVVRREQRVLRHIALIVGKNGPTLKPAVEPARPATQVRGRINHKRMPMSLLASLLSRFEQQLIVDKTGLEGFYEVQLEWAPDVMTASPTDVAAPPPDRPSLYSAVQEQLGLRLEGRRGPLDVLVVQEASRVPELN
jgi:uncharacterized protein (TIGR03435 family)